MPVQTSAKTKIYISDGPATAADFEALTYIEIGEVVSIGEFGSEFSAVSFTALNDRLVRKFKGSEDPGTIAIEMGRDATDNGQAALRTALGSDQDYAFHIVMNDAPVGGTPSEFYARAKVMSYRINIGNSDSITGATADLGVTTRFIEISAAAPSP